MSNLETLLKEYYHTDPTQPCVDRIVSYIEETPSVARQDIIFIKRLVRVAKGVMNNYLYRIRDLLPRVVAYCDEGIANTRHKHVTNYKQETLRNAESRLLGNKATICNQLFELSGSIHWAIQGSQAALECATMTTDAEPEFAMFHYNLVGQINRRLCTLQPDTVFAKSWYTAHREAGKLALTLCNPTDNPKGIYAPHYKQHAAHAFISAAAGALFVYRRMLLKAWKKRVSECCKKALDCSNGDGNYHNDKMENVRLRAKSYIQQITISDLKSPRLKRHKEYQRARYSTGEEF
ncbi:MAG: hypothetical protein AABX52_01230 [Nanoarchaeota archaeon]